MSTTTAKMGLTVPALGDLSPAQVSALAASLALLDAHNHGAAGPVPSAGVNVNAALPFGGLSAQQLRSLQLQSLGAPLNAGADNGSLFVSGGELYFRDGAGRNVKFTGGGALSTGGPFKGDYATAGALASYSHSTRQYTFLDAVNAKASIWATILSTGAAGFGNTAPAIGASGVSFLPANTATNSTMVSCKGDVVAQGGFTHTAFCGYLQLAQNLGGSTMRGVGGGFSTACWTAPRSGSVVAISYYYSVNQTAGNLSFSLIKNNATTLLTTPNFTSGQAGSATWTKDAKPFAAGDRLQLVVNTDSNFYYPFNHVVAYVHVEY